LLALRERRLVPLAARDHLPVQRDRHPPLRRRRAGGLDPRPHVRPPRPRDLLAIQLDPHGTSRGDAGVCVAKRWAENGARSTGGPSPASSEAIESAVTGACSTPLRKCPVAIRSPSTRPAPIRGALSGVPGRSPAAASSSSSSAISGSTR